MGNPMSCLRPRGGRDIAINAAATATSSSTILPPEQLYTKPSGLYPTCTWDTKHVRRLILRGELAPRYPGLDNPRPGDEECPICMLAYPMLNATRCCAGRICTECYLQIRPPRHNKEPCPFCKQRRVEVILQPLPIDNNNNNNEPEKTKTLVHNNNSSNNDTHGRGDGGGGGGDSVNQNQNQNQNNQNNEQHQNHTNSNNNNNQNENNNGNNHDNDNSNLVSITRLSNQLQQREQDLLAAQLLRFHHQLQQQQQQDEQQQQSWQSHAPQSQISRSSHSFNSTSVQRPLTTSSTPSSPPPPSSSSSCQHQHQHHQSSSETTSKLNNIGSSSSSFVCDNDNDNDNDNDLSPSPSQVLSSTQTNTTIPCPLNTCPPHHVHVPPTCLPSSMSSSSIATPFYVDPPSRPDPLVLEAMATDVAPAIHSTTASRSASASVSPSSSSHTLSLRMGDADPLPDSLSPCPSCLHCSHTRTVYPSNTNRFVP